MFIDTIRTTREWLERHEGHTKKQYTEVKMDKLIIMIRCLDCDCCKKVDEVKNYVSYNGYF